MKTADVWVEIHAASVSALESKGTVVIFHTVSSVSALPSGAPDAAEERSTLRTGGCLPSQVCFPSRGLAVSAQMRIFQLNCKMGPFVARAGKITVAGSEPPELVMWPLLRQRTTWNPVGAARAPEVIKIIIILRILFLLITIIIIIIYRLIIIPTF